jgi:hypothetical protein
MSDENTLAATPDGTTTTETPVTPVDDGIIDLDAPEEVKEEGDGDKTEGEEKPEAAAKPEDEEAKAEERKKLSGAQRAKLREQRLLQENSDLQRRLEEATRKTPAADASDADKPPREEDYPDWFAWQQAMTAFNAGKAVRDEIRKDRETREATERSTKQAEIARERREAHLERVEAAREVIADFDQVMKKMDGVQVRQDVIDEIMSSDKSDLISYHLAQNPNELDALNAMNSRELARAMGRLEATLKMPEAKKATSAPAPLSRPKGGAAPSSQESILEGYLNKKYGANRK